jgi:hypothetical protein
MDEDRLAELLERAFERMGISGPFAKFKDNLDDVNDALSEEEKSRLKQARLIKQTNEAFNKLDDSLKKGRKKVVDLSSSIEHLDDLMLDLDDSVEKVELEFRRNALASQYLTAQYKKAGKEFLKATGDILVNGAIRGTKTLVNGLQSGASGVSIASDLMTNSIDIANQDVQAATKGISSVAEMFMMFSPAGRIAKLAAAGIDLGARAFGYVSEKSSDLAKFGIEVMAKEVEKTVKAFNESSAAGALFANGMTGLRTAARDSGLTVEQFSRVIKNNSQIFAESGLTVTEAITRLGGVAKVIKNGQIESRLMRLGYGFEEHAGLVAEVMASMRKSNTLATATDPMIAAATEEYATNLRIISDITGEDAKARMKQAQDQATQYAFNRKIADVAAKTGQEDLLKQVESYLAYLGPENSKIYMQKVVSSIDGISSGFSNDALSNLTGFGAALDTSVDQLYSGSFRMRDAASTLTGFSQRFANESDPMFKAIGTGALYGVTSLNDLSQGASALLAFTQKTLDPETAIKAAEERKNYQDKATEELIQAERETQRLRISLESELTKHLSDFSHVVDAIVTDLRKTLARLNLGGPEGGGAGGPGFFNRVGHAIKETAVSGAIGAAAGSAVPMIGTTAGGVAGLVYGGIKGGYEAVTGEYAIGGIAQGPTTGYQAQLHGTEAVVPLPDNRSIPVTLSKESTADQKVLDTREITSAINSQSGLLNEILKTMKENNNLTSGILQQSY